jgi:hypothetical protein
MPYRWWKLPDTLDVGWLPYSQMLQEYASELANIINELTTHVHRLRAWDKVVAVLDDADKLEVSREFINTLGTVAMGEPYAIKSRFAFAAGHLCHQANQTTDGAGWIDDFPTKNLYLNDIEPYCTQWKQYRRFKLKVEAIAGKKFKNATNDFRNAYNHGFSSRFLVGLTGTVKRSVSGASRCYSFGGDEPLGIGEIADLLEAERDQCCKAFDAFRSLVEEQITAIVAVGADGMAASGGRAAEPPESRELLQLNPLNGDIQFRGRKIGTTDYVDGKNRVSFNLTYETDTEDWVLPLSWLAYGMREAQLDTTLSMALTVSTLEEDVEPMDVTGPVLLVEKILKLDGYVWQFHKSDADHWPSPLHGQPSILAD